MSRPLGRRALAQRPLAQRPLARCALALALTSCAPAFTLRPPQRPDPAPPPTELEPATPAASATPAATAPARHPRIHAHTYDKRAYIPDFLVPGSPTLLVVQDRGCMACRVLNLALEQTLETDPTLQVVLLDLGPSDGPGAALRGAWEADELPVGVLFSAAGQQLQVAHGAEAVRALAGHHGQATGEVSRILPAAPAPAPAAPPPKPAAPPAPAPWTPKKREEPKPKPEEDGPRIGGPPAG